VNWRGIWAIARKDMLIVRRSRALLYPLVIIPVLLLVVLPLGMTLSATDAEVASMVMRQLDGVIDRMPAPMQETLGSRDQASQQLILFANLYVLAPLYLLAPMLVALVVAADAFAGEKERRTLEALLYTPMSDRELLAGKLLAAWVPAVSVSISGFFVYAAVVNLAAWPVMGGIFFPNTMWFLLVFWVGPAIAGLGLGTMVLVSSRVGTLQEATQLGGAVVLPILMLVVAQAAGIIYFSSALVGILGFVIWGLNGLLLMLALRRFRRESLLLGNE
jgi:ABC-2 type transport system permease protein